MSTQIIEENHLIKLFTDCIIVHRLIKEINSFTMSVSTNSFFPKNYLGIYAIIDLLNVTDDDLALTLENEFMKVVEDRSDTFTDLEQAEKLYSNFKKLIESNKN